MHSWAGKYCPVALPSCRQLRTWNALDQTPYYAQAMPKWSKLFAISLFLQCTIAPSLPAMSLSVRNLPVSCLTSFHCVCSPFLAISRNACWGSNITQIQLYLWQFDFWKRIYSCWFGDPLHCVRHKMSLSNNLSSSNLKWKTWWWPAAVQEKKTQRNSWSSWLNSIKRASLSFSFIALKFHFSPAGESFAGGPLRPLLPHPLLLCRRCRRRPHISWTGQRLKRILGILIELLLYFVDGQRMKSVFFSFPWLRGGLWVSTINSKKYPNKCSVGHCSKI